MVVSELIDILEKLDQDLEVCARVEDEEYSDFEVYKDIEIILAKDRLEDYLFIAPEGSYGS